MPYEPKYNPDYSRPSVNNSKIDYSFSVRLWALEELYRFYGTDVHNQQDSYADSIANAMHERILQPVVDAYNHRKAGFFKPYSFSTGMVGVIEGPYLAGLALDVVSFPIVSTRIINISLIVLPALIELTAALYSLSCAINYKINALGNGNEHEHNQASEYLLDAVTRLGLVIPLAAMSILVMPVDLVAFFTRSISTMFDLMGVQLVSMDETGIAPGGPDITYR